MGANCSSLDDDKLMLSSNGASQIDLKQSQLSVDTGKRQSPIDIDTSKVQFDSKLNNKKLTKSLKIIYPNLMTNLVIQNTGYGWKLELPEMVAAKTELIGGPLQGYIYRMSQFHCHWGPNINVGSEHTVNKRSYAAELHFVHWNSSLYTGVTEAIKQPNGLAVVAVFIDIGYQINEELDKLLQRIDTIKYKGERMLLNDPVDIGKLMPANKSYWTYIGSLTTPPLLESVTWIIYSTPIYSTMEQISKFRQLFYTTEMDSKYGGRLLENYRQTQPLNNRIVRFVRDSSN